MTGKEIKQYKSLMWVEVAFWPQIERLYFEWTEDLLKTRMQHDFVYFQIHSRNVATSKIKDFWKVDDPKKLAREWKISHLTEDQKTQVKEYASKMQKNIWRDPTDSEFDNMIASVIKSELNTSSVFICDYWHRHDIWEQCKCFSVYKTFWLLFKDSLVKMWYKFETSSDITPEMQKAFLEKQKQN